MLRAFLTLILCFLLPVVPARAENDLPIFGVAAFEMLGGYPVEGGLMAAARIRLKPGWKTYWREPGGNGIPPQFDWSESKNLASVRFFWPEPEIYTIAGLRTIGYADELVLPILLTPRKKGAKVSVQGTVQFGVCDDVCVPVEADFALDSGMTSATEVQLINRALSKGPISARRAGVSGVACRITAVEDGFGIEARMRLPGARSGQFAVVEFLHPKVWVQQGTTKITGSRVVASATLYPLSNAPLVLDRSRLRITVLGGARAIEVTGCPAG